MRWTIGSRVPNVSIPAKPPGTGSWPVILLIDKSKCRPMLRLTYCTSWARYAPLRALADWQQSLWTACRCLSVPTTMYTLRPFLPLYPSIAHFHRSIAVCVYLSITHLGGGLSCPAPRARGSAMVNVCLKTSSMQAALHLLIDRLPGRKIIGKHATAQQCGQSDARRYTSDVHRICAVGIGRRSRSDTG